MKALHVVVPGRIDDPARPSGGNYYDRRLIDGLAAADWTVRVTEAVGDWPTPDECSLAGLDRSLAGVEAGTVLIDGLVGSAAADVLHQHSDRLRIVVLVHMPLGADGGPAVAAAENRALASAAAVITTSRWTRGWIEERYRLPPGTVHVAEPGVELAEPVIGSPTGGRFLCVGAVIPGKGHHVLLDALARLPRAGWDCRIVGALDRDPAYAASIAAQARTFGLDDRVALAGARTGADLDAQYASSDLLVLPSRGETYGMVVTEALARALPVVASSVGGVPEALGRTRSGRVPGLLVQPDDPAHLAAALREWLADAALRQHLRADAMERRDSLRGWEGTSADVARVLSAAAA